MTNIISIFKDPIVSSIQRNKEINGLYQYANSSYLKFNPFHWVAIAKQIEYVRGERQAKQFFPLFERAPINKFSVAQLHKITDFLKSQDTHPKIYQTFLGALLFKTSDTHSLVHIIETHGRFFSATTWIQALRVMKFATNSTVRDELISNNIDHYSLGSTEEVEKLNNYLQSENIPLITLQTKLDPELLSCKLKNEKFYNEGSFSKFLNFAQEHAPHFNSIHWAVFSGSLYAASKSSINLESFKPQIQELLKLLPYCKDVMGPGELAQIIGGSAPFLKTTSETSTFLAKRLTTLVEKMSKKELLIIIHGIRLASLPSLSLLLEPVIQLCISKSVELIQLPDLFAALVHSSATLGITKPFKTFESLIQGNLKNFPAIDSAETLEGFALYQKNKSLKISTPLLNSFANHLSTHIPKLHQRERERAFIQSCNSFGAFAFKNEEWLNFFYKETANEKLPLWSMISILQNDIFVSGERLNTLVKKIALEYLKHDYDYLRPIYPYDGVRIAEKMAKLFGSEEKDLTLSVIEKTLPHVKFDQDAVLLNILKKALE